jgi:RNA polymerase-associated protein LEO1
MLMDHATATSEINQLLGDSSDDDDEGNVPLDDNQELSAEEVDELPEGHNSNEDELHDLLGDSDDEGDAPTITRESYDNTSGKILIDEQPLIATIRSVNDLDDILGARDADEVTKSPTKDTKDRSVSKMVLPYTYKSKAGDSSIFVRTPNFIKIQSAEYSRLSYNPDQERQFFDGATAVIRWRLKRDADGEVVCDADGIPVKESNARMVEWSDGSMQLVVGDAVFQCKGLSLDNW